MFEITGKPGHKARHRSRLVIPTYAWSIPRDPRAPRFMTQEGVKKIFIQQYPDPTTAAYEKTIAEFAGLLMNRKHVPPTERPVSLMVHAFLQVPKSWSNSEQARALDGNIRPTSRPDSDNYLKVVADALNGVCYKDDSQIVDARIIKQYDRRPALRVELHEMIERKSGVGGYGM